MSKLTVMAIALVLLGGCDREREPDAAATTPDIPGDSVAVSPDGEIVGIVPDTLTGDAGSAPGAAPIAPPSGQPPAPAAGAPPRATDPQPQPATPAATDVSDGAAVLQRAAAAYANVRSLRADFVMNYENPLLKQKNTSRGTLYQRQPDRIALRFTEPAGDVILSDGEYFYLYYPSINAQQATRFPAAAAGSRGVDLQAQFVGNPVERFNYTLHGTESVGGRSAHVMTLVPKQAAEYRSLKVWIDARDALARRFEITERNGVLRRFDLDNMTINPAIPDATFRFTPPEGVRIVGTG